jgi:hypothetical protein
LLTARRLKRYCALGEALRGKLAVASAAANVSIAEEIRRRLERSFENDARDDSTQALVSAAIWIAGDITAQAGAYWHATQKGRQAVAAGIRLYTETMLPSVQAGAGEDLLGPDDPETLGRASARHYQQQLKQYQDADRLLSQDADRPLNLWVPAWGKR